MIIPLTASSFNCFFPVEQPAVGAEKEAILHDDN